MQLLLRLSQCSSSHHVANTGNIQSLRFTQQVGMDVIDGAWIASRLGSGRGEKARLARAMKISPSKLSHVLAGRRDVQPEEMPSVLTFFNVRIVPTAPDEEAIESLRRDAERLNEAGLQLLQRHLKMLLDTPALVQSGESTSKADEGPSSE